MNVVARLACLVAMLSLATGAHAQSITFVSAKGVDNANCSITAPCRTLFQGITVVQTGGTVVVLDSGEFDSIAISKSVTIDATGVAATILTPGTAVLINGTNVAVTLRNLNLDVRSGSVGIQYLDGASVIAEDVKIRNVTTGAGIWFGAEAGALTLRNVSIVNPVSGTSAGAIVVDTSAGSQYSLTVENSLLLRNSRGIVVQGNGNAQLVLSNTTISNSTGNGIEISPTAGITKLTVEGSKIVNNSGNGLMLNPAGAAKINTTVVGSVFDGNVIGIRSFPASPAISNLTISETSASNNIGGIHASGKSTVGIIRGAIGGNSSYGLGAVSPAAVRIGSSVVNGNTLGFSGPISSYGNNQLHGNTNPGSSSPVAPGGTPEGAP